MAHKRDFRVKAAGNDEEILCCKWDFKVQNGTSDKSWQSIDLSLKLSSVSPTLSWPKKATEVRIFDEMSEITSDNIGISAFEFIFCCLSATRKANQNGGSREIKLIVPSTRGYLVRSDIVTLRLVDCEFVELTTSFSEDSSRLFVGENLESEGYFSFSTLLAASAAGVLLVPQSLPEESTAALLSVEVELANRLSISWVIEKVKSRQTLAIVEGSRDHPDNGGTGPSIYLAAKALGIDIVVLDNAGHWLEGPEFSHWRKEFIPVKLTDPPDAEFANRIVKAVRNYEGVIDGIITFCDSYQTSVSTAATRLGLPTSSPEAFEIATDKYKTSVFEGHQAYSASNIQEALDISDNNELTYPMIVKPCNGWSSEGVFRVDDRAGLEKAINSIPPRHGDTFVMEKYCDGPEVNANFVLLDGEILFSEICDDFPKGADVDGPGTLKTFIELATVFPSALPVQEQTLLRDRFVDSLRRLGLTNGILHLEGRVENSRTQYRTQEGILDLHPRDIAVEEEPAPWLIEINPRPPGMKCTQIIESTYGVDYWGLAMLIAIRDTERARILSQQFKMGAQYNCVMVFIPCNYDLDHCTGIFDSDDICADLIRQRPDLAEHISQCATLVKRGDKVDHPDSGHNSWLAYYNVFSRKSRQHALELAEQVRTGTRYTFK
ncbi:Glutathione synthetase ATP-binding protein [Glarea lozoyensis ATCC 20868]|uniref:Glutathione synthetase ATP-binding protein n=1 Tax=Glarea lozoyensis (strain ATCC 20868 / MF5171) TaxID=1116229 RepID=S3DKA7_GLAL2|nr:Glutathione synthetase ATP-binding protein [Glarea lozoyensis ATCC 20868]EPE26983.1 Glutathione synthetase ATP-binding protein [Glarea lozoyensis ATCC 20868]